MSPTVHMLIICSLDGLRSFKQVWLSWRKSLGMCCPCPFPVWISDTVSVMMWRSLLLPEERRPYLSAVIDCDLKRWDKTRIPSSSFYQGPWLGKKYSGWPNLIFVTGHWERPCQTLLAHGETEAYGDFFFKGVGQIGESPTVLRSPWNYFKSL